MVLRSDPPLLVVIPERKSLPIGTPRAIVRQAGMTVEEFLDHLR